MNFACNADKRRYKLSKNINQNAVRRIYFIKFVKVSNPNKQPASHDCYYPVGHCLHYAVKIHLRLSEICVKSTIY